MSEKPEWFELAGEEHAPEQPVIKSKKRLLKLAVFTAPLVLVGGAMVFADGNGPDDAPNINTSIPSASASTTTANKATSTSTNTAASKSITAQQSSDKTSAPTAPSAPSAAASKGLGVQPPSGKGGDDHEGFNGEGEHHDGGEREHHDRDHNGTAPTIPKSGTATTKN